MATNIVRVVLGICLMWARVGAAAAADAGASPTLEAVTPNGNQHPAGRVDQGIVKVALRAARGRWQPEGVDKPTLTVEAFGEVGSALTIPAPLLRVAEGATIELSVHNELAGLLRVHGLCAREESPCTPVEVPAGAVREVRFAAGASGTYHYWATTTGMPQTFRGSVDAQLSGAFIVDRPGVDVADDRVFVITEWTSVTPEQLQAIVRTDDPGLEFIRLRPDVAFFFNGRSWPATERLTYRVGEPVRWRVINLSTQSHPMHLHGFYFTVDSQGDGIRDRSIEPAQTHPVVTQVLKPGATMALTWIPEREGNWLFHCHVMGHVSPARRLGGAGHESHAGHAAAGAGMASMILGVQVVAGDREPEIAAARAVPAARTIELIMGAAGQGRFGFVVGDGDGHGASGQPVTPGPTLVLRRDEPVEITLVNQLPESTSIHWHGMELESYYDGVHGWSGVAERSAPMIEPGERFTVRFTPPRSGTFMYHTHMHDYRQLPMGLYGPMIVVDPDADFSPDIDHVVMVGRSGIGKDELSEGNDALPVVLNGEVAPQFSWRAGQRHRIRLINITPDDIQVVSLETAQGPVAWLPVAKDGATLPAGAEPIPARQTIAVGETYDFEYVAPAGRQNLWINVKTPAGKWQAQGHVIVR